MSLHIKNIMVTGGNAGIGFALCKQLVVEHGCRVFLGSRNADKGMDAVRDIRKALSEDCSNLIELVVVDVGDDSSVNAAAATVASYLGSSKLFALVNNAGVGPQQASAEEIININLFGTKRMVDAFAPFIDNSDGRIVNVGSGAGCSYCQHCPPATQALLCREPASWELIVSWVGKSSDGLTGVGGKADSMGGYGVSKALLHSYTMLLASQYPSWKINACTPGFIQTKLTAGWGASKSPEEGTVAIRKLLFEDLQGNGWYYGSDGVRSPYHFMRNPGEPEYDGVSPY
jgi:carbonyl reductase 1